MPNGKAKIWFSGWFNSITSIVSNIDRDKYHLVFTNKIWDKSYRAIADEYYIEENIPNESVVEGKPTTYVKYAIDFCKEHSINIFFPKNHIAEIAANKSLFNAMGVVVVVEHTVINSHLVSKDAVYKDLCEIVNEPIYYLCKSYDEFIIAVDKLLKIGKKVCFKFDEDEGATSFRVIDTNSDTYKSLLRHNHGEISLESADKIIRSHFENSNKSILVMEFMGGLEVSVDCYNSTKGFIAIPRVKKNSSIEEIIPSIEITKLCNNIQDIYGFEYAWNIQFMYTGEQKISDHTIPINDSFKLLEINPRMSGGLHISSMSGIDIVGCMLSDISGDYDYSNPNDMSIKPVKMVQYSKAIVLED